MRTFLRFPAVALVALFIYGCSTVQPGEDPLVVRTEQTEATAKASFDLVLNIDHANRPFWRTNAPAFHSFCEWLRQPQTVDLTNTLPRASALIWQLNTVKNNYMLARAGSNDVVTALTTLQSAVNQAQAWQTIIQSNP